MYVYKTYLWIHFYCIHFSYCIHLCVHISARDTYIQFLLEGTLQIYMRTASSRISKREIRIDDTADLACGHGSSKNNGEDRGMRKGWEGST